MVSRGVIKQSIKDKTDASKVQYDVWIPFLDGNDQKISHPAVYMTLPHEETILNPGDVVYVAAVDIDFEDIVILGLVNKSSWKVDGAGGIAQINSGSAKSTLETKTGLQITDVQNLSFAEQGKFQAPETTILPRQIKIEVDNKYKKTETLNLHSLTGMETHGTNVTLGNVMWGPKNGGLGFDYTVPDYRQQNYAQKKQDFRSSMGMLKTVIISQEDFDNLVDSTQGLEKNTVYYVFDEDS